jgi:hypothetical protein
LCDANAARASPSVADTVNEQYAQRHITGRNVASCRSSSERFT